MEGHTGFFTDGADLGDGQHGADFVVGIHAGDQAGIGADGILHLPGSHIVALPHVQQGYLKAFLFQLFQGVQHGMVLEGGGDDVLFALSLPQPGGGDNGLIVGLAAAGGENDLPGLTAQAVGNGLAGGIQCFPGFLTHGVQAGGVAVNGGHIGQHGIDGRLAHFGRCRVVNINSHK